MDVGRIIRSNGGFERVTLTEKEEQEVRELVRRRNLDIYQRCLRSAKELVLQGPALLTTGDMQLVVTVADGLFAKEGVDCWAALAGELEKKVFFLKEYGKALQEVVR